MPQNLSKQHATQKMLQEKFIHLCTKFPAQEVTVKMLCHVAELTRSTFYTYYKSTRDLMLEIETEMLEMIQAHYESMFDIACIYAGCSSNDDAFLFKKTQQKLGILYALIHKNRDRFLVLVKNNLSSSFMSKYGEILTRHVYDVVRYFGYDYDEHDYAVSFLVGGIQRSLLDWLDKEDIFALELAQLHLNMILENPYSDTYH